MIGATERAAYRNACATATATPEYRNQRTLSRRRDMMLRLSEVDSSISIFEGSVIRVNEELLAHALFGAALMITAPLNAFHGPRVRVIATCESAGKVTLAVMQQSVAVPHTWPSSPDGPEAYALVPILALRHLAEAYGGRLSTTRLPDARALPRPTAGHSVRPVAARRSAYRSGRGCR